uniref:VWFA domain-containing protein n=1 Tax=Ditylenchus dipsaci TaxID=166011 RepID=A0A915EB00_9BILA
MLRKSSTERTFFGVDVTRLSSIAVVQFTPEAKYEFGFVEDENFERIERKIENIPYLPCLNPDYCQNNLVSWNTIVEWISNIEEGNRPNIPDVIVLVTSSNYQPPELKTGELLVRPRSPIHVFIVSVGQNMPSEAALKPLQFAATTVHLAVLDFKTLNEMVEPLCESVHSFLVGGNIYNGILVVVLKLITKILLFGLLLVCNEISEPQISFLSGSNCIFCLAIFAIVSLVLLSTLFFLMCRYHQETTTFQSQIRKEKEKDASHHKLNVPATSLTRQKGAPSVIVAPAGSAAPGKKKVRETRAEHHFEERRSSDPSNATKEVGGQLTVDTERHLSYNNDEIYHLSDLHTESDDDSLMLEHSMTHLPNEHPALSLPPVDVLLLVDANIAPGRSRVSTILFANEPQVIFDFNRYYTNRAVRAAIERLPYLGGATFLAKALSFAAGFLWQEQNMKQVKHKHRFMPTPRHDRLQVMILVSDGVSDDDFDNKLLICMKKCWSK